MPQEYKKRKKKGLDKESEYIYCALNALDIPKN